MFLWKAIHYRLTSRTGGREYGSTPHQTGVLAHSTHTVEARLPKSHLSESLDYPNFPLGFQIFHDRLPISKVFTAVQQPSEIITRPFFDATINWPRKKNVPVWQKGHFWLPFYEQKCHLLVSFNEYAISVSLCSTVSTLHSCNYPDVNCQNWAKINFTNIIICVLLYIIQTNVTHW